MRRAAAARPLLASAPVRRGAAAVAVTGGAFSLMGAATPVAAPEVADAAAFVELPAAAEEAASSSSFVMVSAVNTVAPLPEGLDDPSLLVKAVQLGEELAARQEAERVAAEERARAEAERAAAEAEEAARRAAVGADCGINTGQLGAVKGFVREAAQGLGCAYDVETMHGVAGRAGTSDHPSGLAVDFMTDRTSGDGLAQCALDNMDALGIEYVIWEQRINHGNGWELMEDRGGVTANHFDHVHVSFDQAGSGDFAGC